MIVFLGQLADNYHMLHREAFWSKTLEQVCKRNKPVNVAKISISSWWKNLAVSSSVPETSTKEMFIYVVFFCVKYNDSLSSLE